MALDKKKPQHTLGFNSKQDQWSKGNMETKMYSIYDSGVKVFHPPFYAITEKDALSCFEQLINTPTRIAQNPEDFDLYYLGTYQDNDGKHQPLKSPQHVIKAIQLVKKESVQDTAATDSLDVSSRTDDKTGLVVQN